MGGRRASRAHSDTLQAQRFQPFRLTPMHVSVEMKMGRLLEIRIQSGFRTVADVDAMFEQVASVVATKMPAAEPGDQGMQKHVTIADWRQCVVLSGEAAALASRNSPSAVMQFLRIVRDSQHEGRRLFFEDDQLSEWLGEVLTPTEAARLRLFLRQR